MRDHRTSRALFVLVYLLSGAAALIYEVVWARLLTLHMGSTVTAVGTVLAAFMGGMAGGAMLAGRVAPRLDRRQALRGYAALEAAIAAGAVLVPLAFAAFRPLLALAYADGGSVWFGSIRVLTSLTVLAAPAAAMGATLPFAVRWFVGPTAHPGREAGALYAANTLGAALGAAGAGFVLLPWLGLTGAALCAVTLNAASAAGALVLAAFGSDAAIAAGPAATKHGQRQKRLHRAHGRRASGDASNRKGDAESDPAAVTPGPAWRIPAALALSGFVALTYEVAWTRVLALVLGPTTYAFSAMLATFIGGLAAGSAIGAWLGRWREQQVFFLGLTLILGALGGFGALRFIGPATLAMARAVDQPDVAFTAVLALQVTLAAGLLLPMTLALGAAFPLAVGATAQRPDALSSQVAVVYAANTCGAIAGALLASFVLVPLLGLQQTVLFAGALSVGGGCLLLAAARVTGILRMATAAAALAAVGVGWTAPDWNPKLISGGAYRYAPFVEVPDLQTGLEEGDVLFYAEGAAGTVSVRRSGGRVALAIDGKVDASNGADMLTQSLLAHLPLLLHPDPTDVGIIGLGSGVTLGAALRHPVEHADVLEISAEVVEASAFFRTENHGALDDPRTRLILGDGRSHMLLSSRRYDVIVSEPSNPWMAGVSTLFTKEFFQAARDRLRPGGILCQWAHTYDMSDADLRSIVATFLAVFPDGAMWHVGQGDLLLIGSLDPLDPRLEAVAENWRRPGVATDLTAVGVQDPFSVLSLYVGGGEVLQRYSAGARIQTDDRNALEFSAPRSILGGNRIRRPDLEELRSLAAPYPAPSAIRTALASATADQWLDRGRMQLRAAAYDAAYEDLSRAADMNPANPAILQELARAAGGSQREQEAIALLDRLSSTIPAEPMLHIARSRLLASLGAIDAAVSAAERAVAVDRASIPAREQLASLLTDAGDAARLAPIVASMARDAPQHADTRYYAAALHFLRQDFEGAVLLGEQAIAADPTDARAQNLLGAALASLGRFDAARTAFQEAERAAPQDARTQVNLGLLDLRSGSAQDAVQHFAAALALDPDSPGALNGLADALERQGQLDRARRLRRGAR